MGRSLSSLNGNDLLIGGAPPDNGQWIVFGGELDVVLGLSCGPGNSISGCSDAQTVYSASVAAGISSWEMWGEIQLRPIAVIPGNTGIQEQTGYLIKSGMAAVRSCIAKLIITDLVLLPISG